MTNHHPHLVQIVKEYNILLDHIVSNNINFIDNMVMSSKDKSTGSLKDLIGSHSYEVLDYMDAQMELENRLHKIIGELK